MVTWTDEYINAASKYLDAKQAWLNDSDQYRSGKMGKRAYEMRRMVYNAACQEFAEASLQFYCDPEGEGD
jgi:hypothetical protein